MASITVIASSDVVSASRTVINDNFSSLNAAKAETASPTFTGTVTVPTPTNQTDAVNKDYADQLAIDGAPNASTTVQGLVEEATAGEVTAGTDTGGTGAKLFVVPSLMNDAISTAIEEAETDIVTSSVFSGTSPTGFTDLNISSVVGVGSRVAILKLHNGSASNIAAVFRRKGDSDDMSASSTFHGASHCYVANGFADTAIVTTNTSGVIEWKTSSALGTITVTVMAFW